MYRSSFPRTWCCTDTLDHFRFIPFPAVENELSKGSITSRRTPLILSGRLIAPRVLEKDRRIGNNRMKVEQRVSVRASVLRPVRENTRDGEPLEG